jgi:ABC-type transport system involved in multi-copper enzyme maturation permease subunit
MFTVLGVPAFQVMGRYPQIPGNFFYYLSRGQTVFRCLFLEFLTILSSFCFHITQLPPMVSIIALILVSSKAGGGSGILKKEKLILNGINQMRDIAPNCAGIMNNEY